MSEKPFKSASDLLEIPIASQPTGGQGLTLNNAAKIPPSALPSLIWDSTDSGVALPVVSITTPFLPTSYRNLVIEYLVLNSAGANTFGVQINGDSGGNYYTENIQGAGAVVASAAAAAATYAFLGVAGTAEPVVGSARFPYYSVLTAPTRHYTALAFCQNDGGAVHKMWSIGGMWNSTAAISQLTFSFLGAGNIAAGSRISVYGT